MVYSPRGRALGAARTHRRGVRGGEPSRSSRDERTVSSADSSHSPRVPTDAATAFPHRANGRLVAQPAVVFLSETLAIPADLFRLGAIYDTRFEASTAQ